MIVCTWPGCQTSAGCQCGQSRLGRYTFTPNGPPAFGWICAACGRSYGPAMLQCHQCNDRITQIAIDEVSRSHD